MGYQRERDEFIAIVTREGLPLYVAETLLREATGFQRRAELACSSEAADRDRVPCPASRAFVGLDPTARDKAIYDKRIASGKFPCLCDDYPPGSHAAGKHSTIPRITLQDWHAEQRINRLLLDEFNRHPHDGPMWRIITAGDPRGYVLRIVPPSYAKENAERSIHDPRCIGVPARESRQRF